MSSEWETARRAAPRWRRWVMPAVLTAVAVAVVASALTGADELDGSLGVEATETPTLAASEGPVIPVAPGDWQAMASGPLTPREDSATAWTGTELLVWGGRVRDRLDTLDDGAAYEPVGDRWRELPASPLSSRGSPAAVWTGREFFLWGGAGAQTVTGEQDLPQEGIPLDDGAAYSPAENRWRTLPDAPLSPRRDAEAVMVGDRILVWGGTTYLGGPHYTDGAIYDPATNGWELLPESPLQGRQDTDLEVVAVDGKVFIASSTFRGIATAMYDPATRQWDTGFGSPPLRGDLPTAVVAVDDAVLMWGQSRTPGGTPLAFRYAPDRREWRTVDQPPRSPSRRDELTPAGFRAVSWEAGSGLIFDAATNRWASMPQAPPLRRGAAEQVWTGDRLLVWHSGGVPDDPRRAAAWVPGETW